MSVKMNNRIPAPNYVTSPGHAFANGDVTGQGHRGGCVCSECKKPLSPRAKSGALTCSDKCRKRRERRQKLQHAVWIDAMHALVEIRDAIKRGEDIEHHISSLNRLKEEINDLLVLAGEQNAIERLAMFEARAQRR